MIEKDKLPGVSIIKPLMGVDDNLMDNLETFFTMNYPLYELLFCFQDVNDPAINVVKTLIDKYPTVNAKMFMGGKQVGINPKINNMIQGYDAANYELLLISDAGLRSKQFIKEFEQRIKSFNCFKFFFNSGRRHSLRYGKLYD